MILSTALDEKIKIWDDVLFQPDFDFVSTAVTKLNYTLGEKDETTTPPTGLISEIDFETGIYKVFKPVLEKIDELKDLYCDRVYVNLFAPKEDAYFHNDNCVSTLLFYCNKYWEINDGGETKFVEFTDEKFPAMIAVPPIPNRLVMFPGNLGHTATGLRNENRFTLAFKMEKK